MSFFSNLSAAIKAEAVKVEAELAPLWPKLKQMTIATAEEIALASGPAVLAQITSAATGAEKLSTAAANIVSTLGAEGKSVLPGLAEGAAQLFYNEIQALRPTPAS